MRMKTIIVIEHSIHPEPDAGLAHLANRRCTIRRVRPFAGDQLPDPADADGVILTGGPQMVTDLADAPYLLSEMDFAMRAVERGIPLLAICLGAQMIAHRLGAAVDWHPDGAVAFGYHQLTPTAAANGLFPPGLQVLSGNAQGFELPPGATLLAQGETWPNQAFALDAHVLAFQFHPEVTRRILDAWQDDLADYAGRPGAADPATQDADFDRHDPALKTWYRSLLDGFFGLEDFDPPA